MAVYSENRLCLGNVNDLTTPSATQAYPLGKVIEVDEGNGDGGSAPIKKYMYVKSHGTLTAYQPYMINAGATAGAEVITASPVTSTTVYNIIGIPQVNFTSGYYGFVQIEGNATAKIAATTHTIGDALEVISGATTLTPNTTSGVTILDASCVAVCKSVSTSAESAEVNLVGRQISIAAS